ncbi:uncharacterized protein LOC134782027 isoform X2 [Penaeus indicus]|uniref:uncharacterized protein LOC134782027 isoform X2 n=1 Tax=Penaeus indicus TaxID=29960 RepID=UPI00300CB0C4
MEHEKENVKERHVSRKNSRRSSILKESPGRKPLVAMESNHHSRRSLKRVSFADTNTIKEFLATMGASTEWNSTYEAPAPQDSSASMDITTLGPKSDGLEMTGVSQDEQDDAGTVGQKNLQLETSAFLNQFLNMKPGSSSAPEMPSKKEEPRSQSQDNLHMETSTFLNQFLNMNPGTEATQESRSGPQDEGPGQDMLLSQSQDNLCMDTSIFLSQFLNLQPGSTTEQTGRCQPSHAALNPSVGQTVDERARLPLGDATQKITADMEMTCPAGQMPKFTGSDMTQKITADMEMTCPAGQMPKFTGSDMKQKITADMEMTCPAGQMPKFTGSDMTQKITADMEMTCPAGQMPKFTGSDMTQKITADMEMTCPAGQMPKFTGSDMTQKITADMEMTCPAGQMPKFTGSDMTQKITADMEMTCPAGQMPKFTGSDMKQKITADMEMTCPAGQMPKFTGSDMTQKISADMEMTCPAGQMPKFTGSDMTQKISADMEMTCPAGQMPKFTGSDMTQKISADMEMTCPAGQMPKFTGSDMTQKISADMEMTCPAGQMPKFTGSDMTQKISADMEMTCPAGQMPKFTGSDMTQKISADMEMTCPAGQMPKFTGSDMTQKITADMEMTCPAGQMPKFTGSDMTQKISADMEMTCPAGQMPKFTGSDMTQKISADMEMTCPAGQMPKFTGSDMTQKISADMEMTCPAGQMPKFTGSDMTQKISADMEMTCPAGQMPKFTGSDMTQKISADMEMTCPAGQMPKFTGSDMTQKISADMEMTCPAGQMPKFTGSDMTQKITADMEITCPASQIPKSTNSDMTQKTDTDMEITCPANQILKLSSSSDMTQKLLTDMEMTCPAGQIPRLSSNETIQAASLGSELTGPAVGKKRRKSILRTATTSQEAEASMPKEERTVMFNLDPQFHCSLISNAEENNDKQMSESKQVMGDRQGDAQQVSFVSESERIKTRPVLQSFLEGPVREGDSHDKQMEEQQTNTKRTMSNVESNEGNEDTGNFAKGSGKRLQGVSPDESSLKVFLSEEGPKCSLSVVSVVGQVDDANKNQNITSDMNVTCSEGASKICHVEVTTCPAGQASEVTSDMTKEEQVDQGFIKKCNEETQSVSIGESVTVDESLDGINLDLENSGDNAETWLHSGSGLKEKPLESSHSVSELKQQTQSRRKSLAADAMESVLPLMSSFMERISMMNHEQSQLEETILKEMTLVEEPGKEDTLHSVEGELEDVRTTPACDEVHDPVEMQKSHINDSIHGHQTILDDSEGTGTMKLHLTSLEPTATAITVRDIPQTLGTADTSVKEIKNILTEEGCLQTSRSTESHGNSVTERMTEDSMQVDSESGNAEERKKEHDVYLAEEKGSDLVTEEITEVSSCPSSCDVRPTTVQRSTPSETMAQSILTVSLENSALQINSSTIQQGNMSVSQNLTHDNTSLQCERCCSSEGCIVFQSKNAVWTVSKVYNGGRCLSLEHTPLELDLQLSRCDNHWTIVTALWKPQASEIQNKCGRLVMSVLGCRVGAAVTRLSGLVFCEAKEALAHVVTAFNNVVDLILEMKLLAALYLTSFEPDSVKVTLFNLNAHVSVEVTVRVHPPEVSPDHPYTLQPAARVTIGNLRCQTLDEAMGEVSSGPRQLLRLIQAANSIVRNMSC